MSGAFRTAGVPAELPERPSDPHRAWLLGNHDWVYTEVIWDDEAHRPRRVAWMIGDYLVAIDAPRGTLQATLRVYHSRIEHTSRIAVADRDGAGIWYFDRNVAADTPDCWYIPNFDAEGLQNPPSSAFAKNEGGRLPDGSGRFGKNTRDLRARVAALVTNFAVAHQNLCAALANR